jgi:hypothetical protein
LLQIPPLSQVPEQTQALVVQVELHLVHGAGEYVVPGALPPEVPGPRPLCWVGLHPIIERITIIRATIIAIIIQVVTFLLFFSFIF